MQLDKFEGADFKYNNIISKFQPKNTQIWHFWSQIYGFLMLHQTLKPDKFKDVDFKYDIFFQILSQKYSYKASSVKIPK